MGVTASWSTYEPIRKYLVELTRLSTVENSSRGVSDAKRASSRVLGMCKLLYRLNSPRKDATTRHSLILVEGIRRFVSAVEILTILPEA